MKSLIQVYVILFLASTSGVIAQGPTAQPTSITTESPTSMVTTQPTPNPTQSPTKRPTSQPTSKPTCAPVTPNPTRSPTAKPSRNPTWTTTSKPTKRLKKKKKGGRKSPKSNKCKKSSKKSSKRPSVKKTKSPAYAGYLMIGSSVVNVTTCTDGSSTYADNWGAKRTCAWLDAPWKLNNNCGTSTKPITILGKNCKYSCRSYNACSCTDATGSFLTHVKNYQPCSWLDGALWKMRNNCGNATTPATPIGKQCRASCMEYNDCGLEYYNYYYTSRRE
jgi:hypothetical protein